VRADKTEIVLASGQALAVRSACSLSQREELIGRHSLVAFMETIRPVNVDIHDFGVSESKVKTRVI